MPSSSSSRPGHKSSPWSDRARKTGDHLHATHYREPVLQTLFLRDSLDKNHLCNGSLQQSKDVILRAKQNSEYLERMHFVFIIRIISTKFIVEKFFCKWSPAGRDSLSSCNYDSFFPSDLGVPAGPVSGSVDNSPGKSFFVNYMDHADGRESLFSTF